MPSAWKPRGRRGGGGGRGQRASAPEVSAPAAQEQQQPRAPETPPRTSLSSTAKPSATSAPSTPLRAKLAVEARVGRKFRFDAKLGSGAFGDIYMGSNVQTGEQVAIKLEQCDTKRPQLPGELRVYQALGSTEGVPRIHWYGIENGCNVLVMDLLGPSLEDLLVFCKRRFSLKTVFMVGYQMIQRVEQLHRRGFIHGDIKPDNFVIGLGQQANFVHLIDLGLATRYRDIETNEHVPVESDQLIAGTPNFASVSAHLGVVKTRRNDLESLGYTLMYFFQGRLPWQSIRVASRKDWGKILESKISTPLEVLCKDCPSELVDYMAYCRKLHFEDEPDYAYLSGLMLDGLKIRGCAYNYVFDWTLVCISKEPQDSTDDSEEPSEKPRAAEAKAAAPATNDDSPLG